MWEKLHGFCDSFRDCFGYINPVAAVVLGRRPDIPSIDAMRCPGATVGGSFMYKDACAGWDKRRSVEIKSSIELRFGGQTGLIRDGRRRFKVVVARGISRHHRCMGKSGSTLEKPAIKRHFQMLMAFSAAFVQCMLGGTNWYLVPALSMNSFREQNLKGREGKG
jgi:hypothetical protein